MLFATTNIFDSYVLTSLPESPLSPFMPCFPRKPFKKNQLKYNHI